MTSGQVGWLECSRLKKLTTQFWSIKDSFSDFFIYISGKEIQIWMIKDSMRVLESLINFIKNLITMKINFLESSWVLIGRNWSLGIGIELWKV